MTRKMAFNRIHHPQNGVTLMSLMAGLLISSISVLATISAYQNLKVAAADTESGLKYDGQIATTLMVIEKYVMNAGYGIADAGLDDIRVVSQAATSTDEATISLLWRYEDGTNAVCTGLREVSATVDNQPYRVLKSISSVSDCSLSADLSALSWADNIIYLAQWPVSDEVADYLDSNDTLIQFNIAALTCSPYGYSTLEDRLGVTISIPDFAELHGALTPSTNDTKICLSNIYPT